MPPSKQKTTKADGTARPPFPLSNHQPQEITTMPQDIKLTLSDGRTAIIGRYKGRHMVKAQEYANNKQSMVMPYIAMQVTTIDGKKVPVEHLLDEMDGQDYAAIIAAVNGIDTSKSEQSEDDNAGNA